MRRIFNGMTNSHVIKVCVSVPGRFHGFDLARELQARNALQCLITSYPSFKVVPFGIEKRFIKSVPGKEIVIRGWHKVLGKYPDWFWLNEWYDKTVARKIPMDADIYVLWAGFALHTIGEIRKRNSAAKIILERGSAHIAEQRRLLELVGEKSAISEQLIEKEQKEYLATDIISIPGQFARRTFVERGIANEKVFVNPYGVDLEFFYKKASSNTSSKFVVGYVGTISKQKNFGGLVNAVEILISKGYDIELVVAGGIDRKSYSNEFLRKYSFIKTLGFVAQTELPKVYQQMNVFVLNSVHDGFGMVLLQAMAMGIIPIATYNTGGPDLIKDGVNGFLIPILDDAMLANRIEFIIKSPQKAVEISRAAVDTVKSGFSWKCYADRAFQFYNRITEITK